MNTKVEGQWGERISLSFELVPHEGRQEEPRTELMSEKEERMLVAESKLFFVLEMKWNFAVLVRNLHGTGLRMNFYKYFIL